MRYKLDAEAWSLWEQLVGGLLFLFIIQLQLTPSSLYVHVFYLDVALG